MPEKAIIYVPHDDIEQSTLACLEYAAACGYEVEGVVVGRWLDALAATADVIVVARPEHARDAVPHIEIVEEEDRRRKGTVHSAESGPPPPGRRRPKPIG